MVFSSAAVTAYMFLVPVLAEVLSSFSKHVLTHYAEVFFII